jgi:hypothetical protein
MNNNKPIEKPLQTAEAVLYGIQHFKLVASDDLADSLSKISKEHAHVVELQRNQDKPLDIIAEMDKKVSDEYTTILEVYATQIHTWTTELNELKQTIQAEAIDPANSVHIIRKRKEETPIKKRTAYKRKRKTRSLAA